MFNSTYQTNGALMVGPVIAPKNVITGETLCSLPENQERLLELAKSHRLRRHSDGWFVDGKAHRHQIWEFGIAKLGLTVTGSQFIRKCRHENVLKWLIPKTIGDYEANFFCDWTAENLMKLSALVGIQRRKKVRKQDD